MRAILILAILFSVGSLKAEVITDDIVSVYATFQQKSTHDNITINYLGRRKSDIPPVVYVSKTPGIEHQHKGIRHDLGRRIDLPKIDHLHVYSTEINYLEANTKYYFIAGDKENGFTPEMSFQTLPDDDRPIVLLQGGDMGPDSAVSRIPKTALQNEPDVILIGGDIAYADGKASQFNRWMQWFKHMNEVMIDDNLQLIPLIVALGNHETQPLKLGLKSKVPYYFNLFPQNGMTSYFSRRLGTENILLVLDTGHAYAPNGKQRKWLKSELEAERDTPNKLAMYHIPMYPGHRDYRSLPSQFMRTSWLETFDKYGITLAFENHDHVYKRTHMLKDNKVVDSGGTVYVGDGCWGRSTRSVDNRWYLHASTSTMHVWSAILESDRVSLQASSDEMIYDEFYINMPERRVVETLWYLRGLPRPIQELLGN
jgi:3',5'-cyclic AMP phosphodiesterase CpdA